MTEHGVSKEGDTINDHSVINSEKVNIENNIGDGVYKMMMGSKGIQSWETDDRPLLPEKDSKEKKSEGEEKDDDEYDLQENCHLTMAGKICENEQDDEDDLLTIAT